MSNLVLIASLVIFCSGCQRIVDTSPVSFDNGTSTSTIESSRIREDRVEDFELASRYVLMTLNHFEFRRRLFSKYRQLGEGPWTEAWDVMSVMVMVDKLKEKVDGLRVDTYTGPKALFMYAVFNNIALDGGKSGPIYMNYFPMRKRTIAEMAGTIAHEVAHRIGLTHPHSGKDRAISLKEPPYVIGDLVTEMVEEQLKQ
jgi:hypothetical protein